jgi:hypothetical protein
MATEYTEVISREAPQIEAYKLGLMNLAKELTSIEPEGGLPAYQVAGMSPAQLQAQQLGTSGVGAFAPLLGQAGQTMAGGLGTLGSAGNVYDLASRQAMDAIAGYSPYQQQAITGTTGAMTAGQKAVADALAAVQEAGLRGYSAADTAGGQLTSSSEAGRGIVSGVKRDTGALGQELQGMVGERGDAARSLAAQFSPLASQIGQQAQALGARTALGAEQQARMAQQGLGQAGGFGMGAAQSGIAQLTGTTGAFNPYSAYSYMNPYEAAVVQQTLADMQRASDIAGRQEAAQAVQAGAFGGSRQGIVAAERARNLLEQQARAAAGLRAQGYTQASEQAQRAFEAQQARAQQAAQLTGQLGQAGAGTALQAALQSGQLGLAGLELGSGTQMQAQDMLGRLEFQAAQLGVSTEEMAARLGLDAGALRQQAMLESGRMGLQAEQQAAANAAQQAALQLQAAQQAQQGALSGGQLGLSGAQLQGSLANQISSIGETGARLGLQGAGVQQNVASGLGALGQAQAGIGTQQAALAEAGQGMLQKDVSMLSGLGAESRAIEQQQLDAQRQTQLQDIYEPYQRLGFYSDILRGAPSSQSTITATTSPQASLGSQLIGGATTAAGLGIAANKAGYI